MFPPRSACTAIRAKKEDRVQIRQSPRSLFRHTVLEGSKRETQIHTRTQLEKKKWIFFLLLLFWVTGLLNEKADHQNGLDSFDEKIVCFSFSLKLT